MRPPARPRPASSGPGRSQGSRGGASRPLASGARTNPAAPSGASSKVPPVHIPVEEPVSDGQGATEVSDSAAATQPVHRGRSTDAATARTDVVTSPTAGRLSDGVKPRSVVSTGLAARLAEREAMVRQRRRRRWAWISGGLVIALVAGWALFFSPLLALDANRIEITGTQGTVDQGAVQAVVADEVGTPLPRLATTELRERLKQIRGVRDVALTRLWPDGLRVSVTAREPVVAVPQASGSESGYTLLDADAVQVGTTKKAPKDIPVVDIPLSGENQRVLEAVLVVLKGAPTALTQDIKTVSAQTQDDITLTLRSGATVLWGGPEDTALKAAVLETLRTADVSKDAKTFDVSAPSAPITK